MMNFRIFSIFVCALTAMNWQARAEVPAPVAPPQITAEFAKQVVDAFNSHTIDSFLPLFHRDFAKCVTGENKDKFAYGMWWGRKSDMIPPDYKFSQEPASTQIADINNIAKNPNAKYQQFPVIPEMKLRIEFKPSEVSSVSKMFYIAWQEGKPYIVDGCPTSEGIAEFDRKAKLLAGQKDQMTKFWKTLDEKTQTAVKAEVKEGRAMKAMQALVTDHNLNAADAVIIRNLILDNEL